MVHAVKTQPLHFEDVISGRKGFEVRLNDRPYKVGDFLALNEWDGDYTGRSCLVYIDYLLADEEYCKDGFVILGIKPCEVKAFNKYPRFCDALSPRCTYEIPILSGVKE